MSKYHNRVTIRNGQRFDSLAEADRWTELRVLEAVGEIRRLSRQPSFVLVDGFKDANGKWESPITYTADFMYEEDDKTIVEDFKGYVTRDYRIKRKLFKQRYGHLYSFREVKAR